MISADCLEPQWWEICCALRHELGEDGFDIFDEWSATATMEGKYDAEGCEEKWKHAEDFEHAYTAGTIFHYADAADPEWKQKWEDSKPKPPPPQPPKPPLITATPFVLRDASAIPVREWLYGRHLIRKTGSATVAPGGAGKSTLTIAEALALVTGRPLLGITPAQCCKVWLWNGEDPLEEIERRITAACLHFGIKAKELEGNLFVNGRESEIIIAQQTRDGVKIAVPMVEALQRTITDNEIDVLCIDPFISSHRVTENDNNSIDVVAKVWTKLADLTNISVDLVHHVRKTGGAEVTIEDARGAGAMINAVRSSRVLNTMNKDEAARAGIESYRGYFRIDDGKMNLAPPSDKAKWYQLKSIDLGNGPINNPFEGGDKVAVVTQWEWPDPLDGVTGKDFEQAAVYIRANKWRDNSQAKDWVGYAIARALHLNVSDKADKAKIIGLLKYWIGTGALVRVERMDEVRRVVKMFVEVAED
ncbi:AAA family ATPase [Bradyrhizobium sp. TZ2]